MRNILLILVFVPTLTFSQDHRTIHVFVALCDNAFQTIVPVPDALGNGQDPKNNLYWGALYGVKTFFKNSPHWQLMETQRNPEKYILERCIFKHRESGIYLVADAYDGEMIQRCTEDFLDALAVTCNTEIISGNKRIETGGLAELLVYIGHDGLMQFVLSEYPENNLNIMRDVIILACVSKTFFYDAVKAAKANPLLWTTAVMSPEAYTLEAAIEGWIKKETNEQIRNRAAEAYHTYQHCGINGARNLLVSGW